MTGRGEQVLMSFQNTFNVSVIDIYNYDVSGQTYEIINRIMIIWS